MFAEEEVAAATLMVIATEAVLVVTAAEEAVVTAEEGAWAMARAVVIGCQISARDSRSKHGVCSYLSAIANLIDAN